MKIDYIYKGEKVAEAKKDFKDEVIETKFLLPQTGRYVKWSTFAKKSGLSEEVLDKIRTSYWLSCDERIFKAFSRIRVDITQQPAVVLGPWDEFKYRRSINSHFSYDVVMREEYYPTIQISCVDFGRYDDLDAVLAKVGYELLEKHFHILLEKWRKQVNKALDVASTINKELEVRTCVQYTVPTKSNPVFETILIGIDADLQISLADLKEKYLEDNKKIDIVRWEEIDFSKDVAQYTKGGHNE